MRSIKVFVLWFLLLMFYPATGCTLRVVDERSPETEAACVGDGSVDGLSPQAEDAPLAMSAVMTSPRMDAALPDVRLADASTREVMAPDAAPLPLAMEGPDFVVLAPTTCSDRRLHLPMVHLAPDRELWHFCYVGPANHERMALPVHDRPTTYTFTRWNGAGSPLIELGSAMAPRTADPWTASVLVSLPRAPMAFPLFNVRTESPTGNGWASVPDPGAVGYRMSGNFRAWRVDGTGVQTPMPLGFTRSSCDPLPTGLGLPTAMFVPEQGVCPPVVQACPLPENPCLP